MRIINMEDNHYGKKKNTKLIEFDQRIAEFLFISRERVSGVKFGKKISLLIRFPFRSEFESIIASTTIVS